jgi:hypothetical protein
VATGVSGPASLIQSDWYTNGHGHYEALVLQGSTLNHYVNDGSSWYYAATVATGVSGPASLIQSDWYSLGSDGNYHGHYEALVRQGGTLNHYVNYQDDTGWHYAATVATGVSAPASLIRSDWYSLGSDGSYHGHYEALVQQGGTLNHYVNFQDDTGWHFQGQVATGLPGVGPNSSPGPCPPVGPPRGEEDGANPIQAVSPEEGLGVAAPCSPSVTRGSADAALTSVSDDAFTRGDGTLFGDPILDDLALALLG